ncbi:hypothetical protein KL940_002526 [Ogataea angusta]|uniref:Peroxin 20 n=1 Tax=Pichia angusta TaxID=870730 RepID=A0ABQ7RWM8_PICAN|nr:hypothetical protein KL940_002526 [Ogataea angusta]
MSFSNAFGDSCGANNALSKFTQRANVDNSLTSQLRANSDSQRLLTPPHQTVDQQLESEYRAFQQQTPSLQPSFQAPLPPAAIEQNQWVDHFRDMNLHDTPEAQNYQHVQNRSVHSTQWRHEFAQSQQQQQQQREAGDTYGTAFRMLTGAPQLATPIAPQVVPATTGQQDFSALDAAFDELEHEMHDEAMDEQQAEQVKPQNEDDKIKFAQLARSVFLTMSQPPADVSKQTSDKFQKSNFLKLMNRISTREVEINENRDKFVDAQGRDIRDMLPDPLKDIKEEGLAGLGPFASAQQVYSQMGDELRPSMWQ